MDGLSVIFSLTFALVSLSIAWGAVRAYRLYGGLRLVTCPETAAAAIVKIQATRAVVSKLAGRNDLRLRSCSRWPERKGCGQECLTRAGGTPPRCSARAVMPVRPPAPHPGTWASEDFVGTAGNLLRSTRPDQARR
jgi:hypothetical protein